MRIDSHQHYWDLSKLKYDWMPPEPSVLRKTYLPSDLEPILERNRFDGSVVVQAHQSMDETRWLLELGRIHKSILGVVAWVDLKDPDLGKTLDDLKKDPKFKGVRHIVHDEPDVKWIVQPDVIRGLKQLESRDIPYDLLFRPPHLKLVPELSEKLPKLRMVIDHIAKPLIKEGRVDGWADDIATAAKNPNIYCKLSGMITEADPKNWKPEQLVPYVRHVIAMFGPERLMFGSDWPVCLLAGSWKEVLSAFTQAIGAHPIGVREKMLGLTAAEFYRIKA